MCSPADSLSPRFDGARIMTVTLPRQKALKLAVCGAICLFVFGDVKVPCRHGTVLASLILSELHKVPHIFFQPVWVSAVFFFKQSRLRD
jgi:hypothetical protein